MSRKQPNLFTAEQRATLRAAGNILIDVADTHFKRGMREIAKAASACARNGLRKK